MSKQARIGSVSSGTMSHGDLIPAFLWELKRLDRAAADSLEEEYASVLGGEEWDCDEADWLLEALFDRLSDYAPPYAHFGSYEGDGADYGFWPCLESVQAAIQDGEILTLNAGEEWPVLPDGTEYVAVISDHGDLTLHGRDGREVWSVV